MLRHAVQEDAYSCPIITANTIAHAVLNKPLWSTGRAVAERLSWFICFGLAHQALVDKSPASLGPHIGSDAPQRRAGLPISELLNPLPASLSQPPEYDSETDSESSDGGEIQGENELEAKSHVKEAGELKGDSWVRDDDEVSMAGTAADSESDYPASSFWEDNSTFSYEDEADVVLDPLPPDSTWFKQPMAATTAHFKREREDSSDSDSGSSYYSEDDKQPAKKYIKAGEGTSKSAVASRALRQRLADGTFKIDRAKYRKWKDKILATDPGAEFPELTVARHSICGTPVRVKEPYDFVRWKDHLDECTEKMAAKPGPKLKTPSLFSMGFVKRSVKKVDREDVEKETKPQAEVPCPGITVADNPKVVQYLKRTGALGGGGRSLPVIAKDLFNKLFSQLTMKKNQQKVVNIQMHEWKWRNDHANLRVFSASTVADRSTAGKRPKPCSDCHTILQSKAFKNAIRRPIPSDKNIIFVNRRFRNPLLGQIYARTVGVREIVEDEV